MAGRVIEREVNGNVENRYSFTGSGDVPSVVLSSSGSPVQAALVLPGGVSATLEIGSSSATWSYPNLHGDVLAVADQAGVKQGPTRTYDPYGNPLRGTTPDNLAGEMDWGWLGGHQRPLEHQGSLEPVIEMGARQYSPRLGRFLEVDPVEGGSCNDYDYTCGDPLNAYDLNGESVLGAIRSYARKVTRFVVARVGSWQTVRSWRALEFLIPGRNVRTGELRWRTMRRFVEVRVFVETCASSCRKIESYTAVIEVTKRQTAFSFDVFGAKPPDDPTSPGPKYSMTSSPCTYREVERRDWRAPASPDSWNSLPEPSSNLNMNAWCGS